jgi:hypothetical protein
MQQSTHKSLKKSRNLMIQAGTLWLALLGSNTWAKLDPQMQSRTRVMRRARQRVAEQKFRAVRLSTEYLNSGHQDLNKVTPKPKHQDEQQPAQHED